MLGNPLARNRMWLRAHGPTYSFAQIPLEDFLISVDAVSHSTIGSTAVDEPRLKGEHT